MNIFTHLDLQSSFFIRIPLILAGLLCQWSRILIKTYLETSGNSLLFQEQCWFQLALILIILSTSKCPYLQWGNQSSSSSKRTRKVVGRRRFFWRNTPNHLDKKSDTICQSGDTSKLNWNVWAKTTHEAFPKVKDWEGKWFQKWSPIFLLEKEHEIITSLAKRTKEKSA